MDARRRGDIPTQPDPITAAEAVPLKYLGVDIAISDQGPVMIEINARPGIEIQNANNKAMRPILDEIHAERFVNPGVRDQ